MDYPQSLHKTPTIPSHRTHPTAAIPATAAKPLAVHALLGVLAALIDNAELFEGLDLRILITYWCLAQEYQWAHKQDDRKDTKHHLQPNIQHSVLVLNLLVGELSVQDGDRYY